MIKYLRKLTYREKRFILAHGSEGSGPGFLVQLVWSPLKVSLMPERTHDEAVLMVSGEQKS